MIVDVDVIAPMLRSLIEGCEPCPDQQDRTHYYYSTRSPLPWLLNSEWDIFSMECHEACALLDALRESIAKKGTHTGDMMRWRDIPSSALWRFAGDNGRDLFHEEWDTWTSTFSEMSSWPSDIPPSIEAAIQVLSKEHAIVLQKGAQLTRGRISPSNVYLEMYLKEEMGAPPSDLASFGRANPPNASVLYLAEDFDTVLSELRPWVGSAVSVGTFHLLRDCTVVDISGAESYRNPFGNDDPLSKLQSKRIAELLDGEFSRPLSVSDAHIRYKPTQMVAATFAKLGYDGLRYRSSTRSGGRNVALFNPESALCADVSTWTIKEITYKEQYVHPRTQFVFRHHRSHASGILADKVPNKGLLRTGDPRTVRPSAEP